MTTLELLYRIKNNLEFIQDPDSRGMFVSEDGNKSLIPMREHLIMKVLDDVNKSIKMLEGSE